MTTIFVAWLLLNAVLAVLLGAYLAIAAWLHFRAANRRAGRLGRLLQLHHPHWRRQ